MPTFPAKTNYASGDVLTAAQMVDVGNGLNDLLPDAKGSLTTVSAANTPAQLTVGNNGETLVADSSASTGLRYQAGNGLAQGAINGAFDIWQRGTSFTAPNYCADRWLAAGGNATYTQESTAANLPTGFRYGIKMTMSATDVPYIMQAIETANAIYFAGKRVVLSYYVASSASSNCNVRLDTSTGTDTAVQGSYTQITPVSGYSATQSTTTTMARKYAVYDVPSDCKSLRIVAGSAVNITSGNTMTITGVQLEVGSVPTEFRRAGGTIAGEFQSCMRYFYRMVDTTSQCVPGAIYFDSTSTAVMSLGFPVVMRTNPSLTATASNFRIGSHGGVFTTCNSISLFDATNESVTIVWGVATTPFTAGYSGRVNAIASGSPTLDFSAEL